MNFYRRFGKRWFDVVLVVGSSVIWLPILCLASLVVWVFLGQPVLFTQVRPGKDVKLFRLYKLRTMRDGSGSDAERLGKIGLFLRATSLDELPSLWNILRGDMSLVGPRPLLIQYLARYTPEQMCRHDVMPGLTGLAQVSGRNLLSWDAKFRLDLEYVQKLSFRLDMLILIKTVFKVLLKHGISSENSVTMPEFTGQSSC